MTSNQILLYESLMISAAKVLYSEGYTTICDQLLDAMKRYESKETITSEAKNA